MSRKAQTPPKTDSRREINGFTGLGGYPEKQTHPLPASVFFRVVKG
jgi:hypothetical protein